MNLYPNQIFHIYNQGNNKQRIFFTDENYRYFTWKMKAYLYPFADIICFCLMPTHFHWLLYVRNIEIERKELRAHVDSMEQSRPRPFYSHGTSNKIKNFKSNENNLITFNDAIGILQMAYTLAINKEKNWTGSLFRKTCKARDGWEDGFVTVNKAPGIPDKRFVLGSSYVNTCFNYIHNNPVQAGIVKRSVDWPYSSAREYAGLSVEHLCNKQIGNEFNRTV